MYVIVVDESNNNQYMHTRATKHDADHTDIWWAITLGIAEIVEAEGWQVLLYVIEDSPRCPYLIHVYDKRINMIVGTILIYLDKVEINRFYRPHGIYDPKMIEYMDPDLFRFIVEIFKAHEPSIHAAYNAKRNK